MTARALEFEGWSAAHAEAAAGLLMARHKIHRANDPALPELDLVWARSLVEPMLERPGFVARGHGEVVGYLVATAITEGPRAGYIWSDLNDHAAVDAETTRGLYAHAAKHWVDAGLRQHVVHVPAVESLLWPWFLSGFGIQHTWSLRDSSPLALPSRRDAVVVRRIGPDEASTAGEAEIELTEHLHRTPVFSLLPTPSFNEATQGQREFLEEPDVYAVVAERGRTHLGYGEITKDPKKDLRAPANSAIMGIVVVEHRSRGSGVGRRITAALLDWARAEGHTHVICDWAAGNLSSSRTFTSFGWRPTFYRLHRNIA
jgi:GNAT superfamily N-acetyltransferase